jgi:rhamnosyltransferase
MEIAARFLEAGYKLAYQGNAEVYHSHNYTLGEQFSRNFDVGAFLSIHSTFFSGTNTKSEGMKMVKTVFVELMREKHFLDALYCWIDFSARFFGNFIGTKYKILPLSLVKKISRNKNWWGN